MTLIAVLEANDWLASTCSRSTRDWLVQQCDPVPKKLSRIAITYPKRPWALT